jgi:hypothetical protein
MMARDPARPDPEGGNGNRGNDENDAESIHF